MALHQEGHFGGGSDYNNKDALEASGRPKIDTESAGGGCLTLQGILDNIGPTREDAQRNVKRTQLGLAGQQQSVRDWIGKELSVDRGRVKRRNERISRWKGDGPPPFSPREPIQDEKVLALAQSLSSYLPCCDPGHGLAFSLTARAAPGDPRGIYAGEGAFWKRWTLGSSTAEVDNNRSTARLLRRYRDGVQRFFDRTTDYDCPVSDGSEQDGEEFDPSEDLDLIFYSHGIRGRQSGPDRPAGEFGVDGFGSPVHIWGAGLIPNLAVHPSSDRRHVGKWAEKLVDRYTVSQKGDHLTDIDTAYTEVIDLCTRKRHIERVNTVDLNPDLSNPDFHGERHTAKAAFVRTFFPPPDTLQASELEWHNPHISSGPAIREASENCTAKHLEGEVLYDDVISEFGIGFGSDTAYGVDWAADGSQQPGRQTGIKYTKLDKDCPGGAHIFAPKGYINADEKEFDRFAHLTEDGPDRFNQIRADLDNQVNYCAPAGVLYPPILAPGLRAARLLTDARLRSYQLIADGWSVASAKHNLYCTRAASSWDRPDQSWSEVQETFPVEVTPHTFQLALEILKVEALEIRAGRPAREACEVADNLLNRPNRLSTDTSQSHYGSLRLDRLSHQFFALDRTGRYPPILRAQSGRAAVVPKYQKAFEENYKRRARGQPELPYHTNHEIGRATECALWTSHNVLFKYDLDADEDEVLDYGTCEYELTPGVTLPNLFSDGYHPDDFWYPPERSYDPDEGVNRVFTASGSSCDEDINGWYQPKRFINVRIPSAVHSVDLHRYTIAADLLVSQAELSDEIAVNYQRQLDWAEKEIRVYKQISRQYIGYRRDLEDLQQTHADTVVKKASLHRLCRDLAPRSFREVKEVSLGFIRWGVTLLLSNRSLAWSNKQNRDRIEELEDQLAALGIQESEERKSKKQRTNLLDISDGHRWTEATTKDLKAIAGVKPNERLAALENLQDTADCQEELSRQFTVRQKEFPELPEQFK